MKEGFKSTEFWVCMVFMLIVLANGTEYINLPEGQLEWLGGVLATYVVGRSGVKASQALKKDPLP